VAYPNNQMGDDAKKGGGGEREREKAKMESGSTPIKKIEKETKAVLLLFRIS
jgi:hypothetical protein